MPRLPSTFALAGWLGFVATSGLMLAASDPSLGRPATDALAAAELVTAATLALALACVNGRRRDRRALGERLGLAAFASIALVAAVASVSGLQAFPAGTAPGPFWTFLVLGVLAIGFDRVVTEERLEDDGAAFEAGITAIAEAMARQTHRYPLRPDRRTASQGSEGPVR